MSPAFNRNMLEPLAPKTFVQPKLLPSALYQGRMARDRLQVLRYRQKVLFTHFGQTVDIADSAGSSAVVVHRFIGRLDPWVRKVRFQFGVARANYLEPEDYTDHPSNCAIRVDFTGGTIGTSTHDVNLGVSGGGASLDVPSEWAWPTLDVAAAGEEDVGAVISVVGEARLITVCAWAIGSSSIDDYDAGDTGAVVGGPIYSASRERVAEDLSQKWREGATGLITWSKNGAAATIVSATYANVNGAATSVTAATPGWTIDATRHNTVAQSTVPVFFKVYGQVTSGTGGRARLASSSGAVIEVTGIGTALQWWTVTGTIPAGSTKMDLQIRCDGAATLSVYAACLFEYQA